MYKLNRIHLRIPGVRDLSYSNLKTSVIVHTV